MTNMGYAFIGNPEAAGTMLAPWNSQQYRPAAADNMGKYSPLLQGTHHMLS